MNGTAQTVLDAPGGSSSLKSVCSEVDPAVCEPSTVAGLQDDEETLCARGFSVSPSQACF